MVGVRSGVTMPLPGVGRFALANSTMVVPSGLVVLFAPGTPPLLATQRFPMESNTMPSGPLKAAEVITTAGTVALIPVPIICAAVNTITVLLLWSVTHWLPAASNTDCCGKFNDVEVMTSTGSGLGVVASAASCAALNFTSAGVSALPLTVA